MKYFYQIVEPTSNQTSRSNHQFLENMEARGIRQTTLHGYNQPNPESGHSRGQMIQVLHPKYGVRKERGKCHRLK